MTASPRSSGIYGISRQQIGFALLLLSGTWGLLLFRDFYFSVISLDATSVTAREFYCTENGISALMAFLGLIFGALFCWDLPWKKARDYAYRERGHHEHRPRHGRHRDRRHVAAAEVKSVEIDDDTVSLDRPTAEAADLLPPDTPGRVTAGADRVKIKHRIKVRIRKEKDK